MEQNHEKIIGLSSQTFSDRVSLSSSNEDRISKDLGNEDPPPGKITYQTHPFPIFLLFRMADDRAISGKLPQGLRFPQTQTDI